MIKNVIQNLFSRFLKRSAAVGLVALAAMLSACGADTKPATQTTQATQANSPAPKTSAKVLRIGYVQANKLNLPGNVEGYGFYKEIYTKGLKEIGYTDIQFTSFPNGPDLNEGLVSGRLDIGILGDTPGILAHSAGASTRVIAQNYVGNVAYIVTGKNGPKSIEELKGKTVAVQKGSYLHRFLIGLLEQKGLTDSVKIIHLLQPDAIAALETGKVDAISIPGDASLQLKEQGYELLDSTNNHPDLRGTSVTVASESFLKNNPEFVKKWVELRKKSIEAAKANETDYWDFMAKGSKFPVDILKQSYSLTGTFDEPFTDEGLKLLDGTRNFLVQSKLATKDFNINDWIIK